MIFDSSRVTQQVFLEARGPRETCPALLTGKGAGARVAQHVAAQVVGLLEACAALAARVRLLPRVLEHVAVQRRRPGEHGLALTARLQLQPRSRSCAKVKVKGQIKGQGQISKYRNNGFLDIARSRSTLKNHEFSDNARFRAHL